METKPIGIYVHVPFCKRKCNYCDFCSEAASEEKITRYTDALCEEISGFRADKAISVDTVFFGGGTPSLLSVKAFKKIMDTIKKRFNVLPSAEITAEVNPGTVNEEKAIAYLKCGVNRISIGTQSIHENELKKLGRIHSRQEFLDTFKLFKAVGIENISVDLMYGIPEQTVKTFEETLSEIISLSPSHISCYGLILEEGTPFFDMREKLNLPTEEEEYEMYSLAHSMLSKAGYRHYEISNYARDGRLSQHNLKYWHSEEYLGFGISAHSYFEGKRFFNTSDFSEYFTAERAKYCKEESDFSGIDPFEYAMLAFRLDSGFSLSEYKKLFGIDFCCGKNETIERFSSLDLLRIEDGRIFLTHKGFYVSNSILSELL